MLDPLAELTSSSRFSRIVRLTDRDWRVPLEDIASRQHQRQRDTRRARPGETEEAAFAKCPALGRRDSRVDTERERIEETRGENKDQTAKRSRSNEWFFGLPTAKAFAIVMMMPGGGGEKRNTMTMTSDGSWREQPREQAIARCSTSKHARLPILRLLFAADLQIHETDSITNDHRSVASRLALSFRFRAQRIFLQAPPERSSLVRYIVALLSTQKSGCRCRTLASSAFIKIRHCDIIFI